MVPWSTLCRLFCSSSRPVPRSVQSYGQQACITHGGTPRQTHFGSVHGSRSDFCAPACRIRSPWHGHQHHRGRACLTSRWRPPCHAGMRDAARSFTSAAAAKHGQAESRTDTPQPAGNQVQLFNTLSSRKEAFQPRESAAGQVLMYVCGVTVYDFSHVGHARVYTTFDLLYRLLQRVGYKVQYVRNFTDIDDKIINRANQNKENIAELSNRFIAEFHHDMRLLNCLEPTLEPRATDHVECMVDTIERIIANKHAYAVDGNVWFDVASLPGYGRLSGRSCDDDEPEQQAQPSEDGKRSAADFALWKSAKPGEPTWDSPWGPGRPGWHLECSSMIRHLMGPVIDIHGGGRDLVFPHHENEIAQSQAAADEHDRHAMSHGRDFVRFWVHNGFVNVDSEKMSKSLGNFFTIRDVLKLYPALALRLFLLSTQYRQAVNYTQRALEEATDRLYYMYQTVHDAESLLDSTDEGRTALHESASPEEAGNGPGSEALSEFEAALCDDLNTPEALGALAPLLRDMNDLLHTRKGRKAKHRLSHLAFMLHDVCLMLDMLGLWTGNAGTLLSDLRALALSRAGITEDEVAQQITARAEARQAKDFAKGDSIRDQLADQGILLMDTPEGTAWRPGPKLDAAESSRV